MNPASSPTPSGAETVRWDLRHLYPDVQALDRDLDSADADADGFAAECRGQLSSLDGPGLAAAMGRLESIHDRLGKAYTYAYLAWSTDTNNPERGALLQRVREAYTKTLQKLVFFELEWAHLGEDQAVRLLSDPVVEPYRHYLELQRLSARYLLTEAEEKVLAEKDVTGRSAWSRYFDESLGAARFPLRGEDLTEQEVLSKLHDADRSLRRDAALAFTDGLRGHLRTLTYVFNTILADKASNDRMRTYPHWLASRNLANEVDDANVQALIDAVTSRYDLVERFYRLKRTLLGYEVLHDYDRYAPLGEADRRYSWDEARQLVLDAYGQFSPRMADIARRFFDESWIDAPVAPGKRGGAFSHGAVPSAHPYILMNYTGKIRDVQTLAHELGHGVHQFLSRGQGIFQADTPLTTAETASVFGEMLVFQSLMRRETNPGNRLAMLVAKIDDTVATVFRQVSMNRFENRIHQARREGGELSAEAFSSHWIETQEEMFRGSVSLGDHYRIWWSYIPHFIHTPGYVYAYAFGELLVLALYARYLESPSTFVPGYVRLLEAGGSNWPHELVAPLGVDLTDAGFWSLGLDAIEALIREAEALSAGTPATGSGDQG